MVEATQGSPEHYKGQYASLKFPAFKQQEYPKLIYADEGRKKILGTANNAMEEKELYASIGVDKIDVDPLGAALDEVSVLRAKLAQYEGTDATQQIAPAKGVRTNTVEMLPDTGQEAASNLGKQANPLLKQPAAAAAVNPLLPQGAGQAAGNPQPLGTAPKMDAAKPASGV